MSDKAVELAQGLRDWEEENPWKSIGLGFVPAVGSALGLASAASAWIDPRADNWDKALSTAGVLPLPIGKIAKALRGKKSLPDGALGINTAHGGTSVIERPDPGRLGEGEGNVTEGPGFYTTTDLIHEPTEYANTEVERKLRRHTNDDDPFPEGFVNYYDIPDRDLPYFYDKHGRDVDMQSGKAVKSVYDFMREYRPEHFDDVMTTIDPTIRKMVKEGADAHDIERKIQEEAMKKFHQEVMGGEFRKAVGPDNRRDLQRTREELLSSGLRGFKASTKQNSYGEYLQGTMADTEQDYLVALDPERIKFLGAEALTDVQPRNASIRRSEDMLDRVGKTRYHRFQPYAEEDIWFSAKDVDKELKELESVNVDLIPAKPVGDHIQKLVKELRDYRSSLPPPTKRGSKTTAPWLTKQTSLSELDTLVKNMDEAFKGLKK